MIKRKLRFFCDYMADSPLWESWDEHVNDYWAEGEYNKSRNTLLGFGVTEATMQMMETLQVVFEWPSAFEDFPETYAKAYDGLSALILERLQEEIGDKFEIEVL